MGLNFVIIISVLIKKMSHKIKNGQATTHRIIHNNKPVKIEKLLLKYDHTQEQMKLLLVSQMRN